MRENRHWKLDVVYNTTLLPRRRDTSQLGAKVTFGQESYLLQNQLFEHKFIKCMYVCMYVDIYRATLTA